MEDFIRMRVGLGLHTDTPSEIAAARQAREKARREAAQLRPLPCPVGGSTGEAFAKPRLPRPGEIGDIDAGKSLLGWKVVRGTDLWLPSGRLLETSGEALGAPREGKPVDLGVKPGRYPWFLIVGRYGDQPPRPMFSQLVLDATHRPVRWQDEKRFGFGTDGGMGFISSPEAAATAPALMDTFDAAILGPLEKSSCAAFRNSEGWNFVVYENGWGDGWFQGSAGYDAAGRLVAITWALGPEPWVLGGFPGVADS